MFAHFSRLKVGNLSGGLHCVIKMIFHILNTLGITAYMISISGIYTLILSKNTYADTTRNDYLDCSQ